MALVKLRHRSQITLPADLRRALQVREGDYLEAALVEGGLMLKPVAIVDRAAAWREIEAAQASVRPTAEQAGKSEARQEQEILEIVNDVRREYAEERRRR